MTRSAKSALALRADDWQIEVNDGNTKNLVPSGPLYLKRIIAEAMMDSTATLVALRQSVSALKITIATVNYDTKRFCTHVRRIVADLAARGEEAPDLVDHLITVLISVPDASFVGYITRRQDAYEEGEEVLPKNLMDGATNKFNALTLAKKWMVRSPEETRIVMLEAKLKAIERGNSERPKKDNGATKRTKGDK